MPASQERYELLRKRLARFTRMIQGVGKGDVRALHRTRVASRRLRELLPVLQLDADVASKLGRRLRKVTERLGVVRELDVLILLLDELHDSSKYDPRAIERVAAVIARERDDTRERLQTKLSAGGLQRLARKFEKVAAEIKTQAQTTDRNRQNERAWRWVMEARIARRAEQLAQAIDNAGAVYLPDRLHLARIGLKKLRYAVELSTEAGGIRNSPDLRTLKRGQDLLGRLHDYEVLVGRVRQLEASMKPTDAAARRELDALLRALEDTCRGLHARYMRGRPAIVAICDRCVSSSPRRGVARRAS